MSELRKPLPPGIEIIPPDRTQDELRGEAVAPRSPWNRVAVFALLLALYVVSPIDLIPDFIPLLGQLDDVLVGGGLLGLIARTVIKYYTARRFLKSPKRTVLSWLWWKLFRR